jgi:hypothetical protein
MGANRQGRYGHSQSPQTREKISRTRQKVARVIEVIRVASKAPSKVLGRDFVRTLNLRKFCVDRGLDNRNLRKTLKTGGWCSSRKAPRGEGGIVVKHGLRACLENPDSEFEIGCRRHSQQGAFDETCPACLDIRRLAGNRRLILRYGEDACTVRVPDCSGAENKDSGHPTITSGPGIGSETLGLPALRAAIRRAVAIYQEDGFFAAG